MADKQKMKEALAGLEIIIKIDRNGKKRIYGKKRAFVKKEKRQ